MDPKDQSQGAEREKLAPAQFEDAFRAVSKSQEKDIDSASIALKDVDKWFEQSNITGGKSNISKSDTSSLFKKFAKNKDRLSFPEFQQFLQQLASTKNMDCNELFQKLLKGGMASGASSDDSSGQESGGGIKEGLQNIGATVGSLFKGKDSEEDDPEDKPEDKPKGK